MMNDPEHKAMRPAGEPGASESRGLYNSGKQVGPRTESCGNREPSPGFAVSAARGTLHPRTREAIEWRCWELARAATSARLLDATEPRHCNDFAALSGADCVFSVRRLSERPGLRRVAEELLREVEAEADDEAVRIFARDHRLALAGGAA